MADRTVTTRLKLDVSGWTAGSGRVQGDLRSLNRSFTESAGFAKGFRQQLENATKRLPKIEIDLNSSPAEVKIAVVRGELEKLSKKKIGVDIDAASAISELALLQQELASLGDEASFEVRASIGQALTDLATVEAEVRRLDDRRIRLDVDTSGALSGIGKLGDEAGALGGKLTSSLGVIGSVGPAQVALVVAAIQALPTVASLAATGIVFSIGSALTTLGIAGAAQSDKVRFAWTQTAQELKRELGDVAEPFEDSLVRASRLAESTFERLAPKLRRIFTDLVPDVDNFIEGVAEGIVRLGPSLEKIGDSFGDMLSQLGDRMPAIMDNLGETFETVSAILDDNPQMLANLIEDATQLLSVGAEVLAWADDISAAANLLIANPVPLVDKIMGGSPQQQIEILQQVPGTLQTMELAVRKTISAAYDLRGGADGAAAGIRNLNTALEEHFDPAQKALDAEIRLKQAIQDANEAAKSKKLTEIERLSTVKDMTTAIRDAAKVEMEQTGATKQSTEAFISALPRLTEYAGSNRAAKDAIAALGESLGITTMKTKDGIIAVNELGKVIKILPNGKRVEIDANTKKGKAELDAFMLYIARQKGTIDVHVRTIYDNPSGRKALDRKARAMGGIQSTDGAVTYMAAGGMMGSSSVGPPPPKISSTTTFVPGSNTIYAEAGKEAYIPYAPRYRRRAVELLSQVAEDFGLEVYSGRAADRMSDAGITINAAGMQVSTGLGAAVDAVSGALGQAGTLTSEIHQVGVIGDQMSAGWSQGSQVLGESVTSMAGTVSESVTGMSDSMTGSIDYLSDTVLVLGDAVAQAAQATSGKTSSTNSDSYKEDRSGRAKRKANTKSGKGSGASEGAIIGPNFSAKPKANSGGQVAGSGPETHYVQVSGGMTGTPYQQINTAQVSAPQQVSSRAYAPSRVGEATSPTSGGGSGGSSSGPAVVVQTQNIYQDADADRFAAQAALRTRGRGR